MSQLRPGGQRDPARESQTGQARQTDLLLKLLAAANQADEPGNWLASALPAIAADLAAGYVAVAVADAGRWNALAEAGPARSLPVELLAEVLDREAARSQGNWVAGPLASRAVSAEALVAYWPSTPPPDALAAVESLLPVVREAFASVRVRHQQLRENPSPGDDPGNCRPVVPDAGDRAAVGADGRGGHALAEGRPGQHLPLGPRQPLPDRPPGLGRQGRRTPRGRRPRRRGTRVAVGPAGAGRSCHAARSHRS